MGIGQRRLLGDRAGNALAELIGVEIEPRFGVRRELVADIAADADGAAETVIPEAVLRLRRGGDEAVPGPLAPPAWPCSRLNPSAPISTDTPFGHGSRPVRITIDGAAEQVRAELQRSSALQTSTYL